MGVKTPHTVSPRVPAPWRSAQGEAGPKARPQRRSRWRAGEDSGPVRVSLNPQGTVERRAGGLVDVAVQPSRAQAREGSARAGGDPQASGLESTREKSLRRRDADVRTVNRHRWARRAASGGRVKPGQGTRHTDPVTSEEGVRRVGARIYSASRAASQ